MKLYVAGPMTWIPQHNIPLFDAAADKLRDRGHDVVSPAELDDPETRAMALASPDGAPGSASPKDETWGDFLARDVKLLADDGFDGIVVLPNWHQSRGARLEVFVGLLCGLRIFLYHPLNGVGKEITDHALRMIHDNWPGAKPLELHERAAA